MAGYTDSVFRRICGEMGADYAVSEMISAAALVMRDRKTAELAKISEGEPPVVLQLFGHDPRVMAEAAELLLTGDYPGCSCAAPPAGIDINMGCPVRKITANGDGSALMLDPPLAARITAAALALLSACGFTLDDVASGTPTGLPEKAETLGYAALAARCGVGEPTLRDITAELMKPGRDPRDALPPPILRGAEIMEIKDLKPGMILTGTVRNVIDFGAFVDIGVHRDGLVHISQICDRFIRHPSEVLSVGDVVRVVVLEADAQRGRINLSIRQAGKQ